MNKRKSGDLGEKKGINFLKTKGYQVLDTNFLKRSGEIDIITFDPSEKEYVFVEVKTRKNDFYGYPEDFVDDLKLAKIEATADHWLKENNLTDAEWRIDIISLIGNNKKGYQVKHLKNV